MMRYSIRHSCTTYWTYATIVTLSTEQNTRLITNLKSNNKKKLHQDTEKPIQNKNKFNTHKLYDKMLDYEAKYHRASWVEHYENRHQYPKH